MTTPSFPENNISQIPALQVLCNLGYTYLTPEEVDRQRRGKLSNVILLSQLATKSVFFRWTSVDYCASLLVRNRPRLSTMRNLVGIFLPMLIIHQERRAS